MTLGEPARVKEEPEEAVVFRDELVGTRVERLNEDEAVLWAKLGGALCGGVAGALMLPPPQRAHSVERHIFSSGWTFGFTPAFPAGALVFESWF